MATHPQKAALFAVALAALGACTREPERVSVTQTTSAAFVSEGATDDITTARCNREQACKHLGAGQRYPTFDACRNALAPDTRATAQPQECSGGISDQNLSNCLSDIRNEPCENRMDSIALFNQCQKGNLCR